MGRAREGSGDPCGDARTRHRGSGDRTTVGLSMCRAEVMHRPLHDWRKPGRPGGGAKTVCLAARAIAICQRADCNPSEVLLFTALASEVAGICLGCMLFCVCVCDDGSASRMEITRTAIPGAPTK